MKTMNIVDSFSPKLRQRLMSVLALVRDVLNNSVSRVLRD